MESGGLDLLPDSDTTRVEEEARRELASWSQILATTDTPGWKELLDTVFGPRFEQLVTILADVTEPRILYRTQGEMQVIARLRNIRTEAANQIRELDESLRSLNDAAPEGDKNHG